MNLPNDNLKHKIIGVIANYTPYWIIDTQTLSYKNVKSLTSAEIIFVGNLPQKAVQPLD